MMKNILGKLGFITARWEADRLIVLDQRKLPFNEEYITLKNPSEAIATIKDLAVRGAPLIGIVAAYGLCLVNDPYDEESFSEISAKMASARPTAVNLAWAVERMAKVRRKNLEGANLRQKLIDEACRIQVEDADMCLNMGEIGNEIIPDGARILTHCNAGALATGGIGTALGIIYTAHFAGKKIHVWVDETRPILQGARLTSWELSKAGVPLTLITDNMAGHVMAEGKIDLVITGADRVAANLDFANKIGTYGVAVLAYHHKIPFYAAAPSSTFDAACPDGKSIIIENRSPNEVKSISGVSIAPDAVSVYNPAFDITPHELVAGIISETGIRKP